MSNMRKKIVHSNTKNHINGHLFIWSFIWLFLFFSWRVFRWLFDFLIIHHATWVNNFWKRTSTKVSWNSSEKSVSNEIWKTALILFRNSLYVYYLFIWKEWHHFEEITAREVTETKWSPWRIAVSWGPIFIIRYVDILSLRTVC